MTRAEKRAASGLAAIFGLRMLGMFLILPVFALYAEDLPGGDNHTLVGLALGMYGLTQAILMIPFGMASDRIGRKKVIIFGLIVFAFGSFVAMAATDIYWTIFGRALQGAGAISAAVTAMLADLTREEHRTKAMALVGSTIGITFAVSLVAGPALNRVIGVPGIFALTGVLALAAIWVVKVWVPDPADSHYHADAQANPAKLKDVLRDGQLARLDFGIFALHAAQMAMFVVVPVALKNSGLAVDQHWAVYLPVLLGSFVLMVPAIIVGEKRGQMKPVFIGAVALMLLAQLGFAFGIDHFWGIVWALFFYFVAFNLLEASLPSLISKLAPVSAKGTAMGVYNTAQALGLFFGGVFGGWLAQHHGFQAVFIFCVVLMAAWLVASLSMKAPPAIKTRMFRVGVMPADQAALLKAQLAEVAGVVEAVVLAEEGVAMLKVSIKGWDEAGARSLLDTAAA
ncbi:MFS transporter [Thiobacillus denitrificans]|uniref:Membrane protein n=1 Tax=Thiobacillus denitrificans TaxID=36861 RepID=A0A106BW69_THIDE|nr:MFS transporter [Thiobacillus denitrificans]KVW99761.1 membrane protein [Thiobacillus denitrificans]